MAADYDAAQVERNKQILELVKAYKRLPQDQRTKANALKIFAKFNTNNNGNSKDKLDNVDQIDDYFKNIMGITVMSRPITQEEFLENIDDWVVEFAKYKAPKAPDPEPEKPLNKVDPAKAKTLGKSLINELAPLGATGDKASTAADHPILTGMSSGAGVGAGIGAGVGACAGGVGAGPGAFFGGLIGGAVGLIGGTITWLCADTPEERFDKAMALFGSGEDKINSGNIVEVLSNINGGTLNRLVAKLDDGDAVQLRVAIADCLDQRVKTLVGAKCLTAEQAQEANGYITMIQSGENLNIALVSVQRLLGGKGIKES